MDFSVDIEDSRFEVTVHHHGGQLVARMDGKDHPIQLARIGDSEIYSFLLGNRSYDFEIHRNESGCWIQFGGRSYMCHVEDKKLAQLKGILGVSQSGQKQNELCSPMPGLIVSVNVKEGDEVKAGQGVVVIEAMKMENELRAPCDGVVKLVNVKEKVPVEQNHVLVVFE